MMKKSIIVVIAFLSITLLFGAGDEKAAAANITNDNARNILQAWVNSHPFQLGSSLDAESDKHIVDGVEYYRFYLGIVRLGVAEILVDKETGKLFHLASPYATVGFAPIDEWYYKDHAEYAASLLTVAEARSKLETWLAEHPLNDPPITVAPEYTEHTVDGAEYVLFSLAAAEDYWPKFLVNRKTGELLLVFTPDDLKPPVTRWLPDEWYNEHFNNE